MATGAIVEELKREVQSHFEEILESIQIREKLLLRQIDVIASQSQNNINNTLKDVFFIPEGKVDLLASLRSFGKFNLDNLNFATDLYVNEDYISPAVDHEIMYKCLQKNGKELLNGNDEKIIVDFSSNKKLIKENVSNINESIINITLNEAKELIRKAKPLDSLKLEKEVTSQSSQTDKNGKAIKANITINNCNGTINLKNISSLTINCAKEDSFNVEKNNRSRSNSDDPQDQSDRSNESPSNANSTKDNENNSVNCEFYNRLIAEIKNSLKQGCRPNENIPVGEKSVNEQYSKGSSDSTSSDSYNRKYFLKNFENLKIVLENNENEARPIQIEQWLAEIISETEIEPIQNQEILEHSKIHSKEMN